FFFSSIRRHTRFSRDWSSDVCSSDLDPRHARARYAGTYRAAVAATELHEPGLYSAQCGGSCTGLADRMVCTGRLLASRAVLEYQIGRASFRVNLLSYAYDVKGMQIAA